MFLLKRVTRKHKRIEVMRNSEGQVMLWHSEDSALDYIADKADGLLWVAERAGDQDYRTACERRTGLKPRLAIIGEIKGDA